jgi:hypothetical protein
MRQNSRMQVLLDGLPIAVARPTLADALAAGTANAQSRGRIIIEVKADGVALSDDKLGNPSSEPSGIRELRLLSADPRALVQQTVLDTVEALDQARMQQARAAELIQSGQPEEALNILQVALVTWQAVRDVVSRSAAVLDLNLETIPLRGVEKGVSFNSAITGLVTHLDQVRSGLEQQDWSAVSDVVGYDMDVQAGVWRGLLVAFAEYVGRLPAKAEQP